MNSVKFHETALHHAARLHEAATVELLVEFGAHVSASDNLGKKPADYAAPASPAYARIRFYESTVNPLETCSGGGCDGSSPSGLLLAREPAEAAAAL